MLEKPDLPDEKIIACSQDEYGLHLIEIAFLPLGADVNTAVYRVVADNATPYFLKLRRGVFDEISVAVPHFLRVRGIAQIIAPVTTRTSKLWARVDGFTVILYPFVKGQNGFDTNLSDRQWVELGIALKGIHTAVIPPTLTRHIPRENYSPHWREMVTKFQVLIEETAFDDPVAKKLAVFMRSRRDVIHDLVARSERLALALQSRLLEFFLCHADIHAANILIAAEDSFYIVDWDNPILAPKERDLMFVGAGLGICDTTQQAAQFYQGYGQTEIDPMALAYYRYERIIEDIAAFCEQLFLTDEGGADRERALHYFVSSFLPNHVVDIAYKSEARLNEPQEKAGFSEKPAF